MEDPLETPLTPPYTDTGAAAPSPVTPLQKLKLKWVAEKACPEILPYAGEEMEAVQSEASGLELRLDEVNEDPRRTLDSQILTMDLDRATFVVRSYLRCRIGKIDKYFLQIFGDADLFDRLSKPEQDYCQRSIELTQRHMDQSVLHRMPAQYSNMIKQSDTSQQPDMIPEAPIDSFVFCKANRLLEDIPLDDKNDTVTLREGNLHVLHYRPIRQLIQEGSVQLF